MTQASLFFKFGLVRHTVAAQFKLGQVAVIMVEDFEQRAYRALHAYSQSLMREAPATPPIVMSAKYKLPDPPEAHYIYGREANPTLEAVEAAISCLEEAPTVCFPSGMGAISAALFASTNQGDRILLSADGYFAVRKLFDRILARFGVEADFVRTVDLAETDLTPYTVVWAETPSNPGLDVCDLSDLARRCRAANCTLIVDNTTPTPLLQSPIDLGAHISVCSDTKALSGHSDVLFGHCASRDEALLERILEWRVLAGNLANPLDAFLVHRGLMTLELRLERMCSTAQAVAELITSRRDGPAVRYPGLKTDPSFALASKQMRLPGFLVGATFDSKESANRFIDLCPSLFPSTSFGGVHSSAERRERWGDVVPEGFVRMSFGCEPTELILQDIEAALDAM